MKSLRFLLCAMIGLVIGSVVGIVIVNIGHDRQKRHQTTTTEAATEEMTAIDATAATPEDATPMDVVDNMEADEETTTEDSRIPDEEQPQALVQILRDSLVDFSQLEAVGCRQLIVVKSEQEQAEISMYVCDTDGRWNDVGLSTTGYVGSNGVSRDSYEGSRMTPAGVFPVGDAFYIEDAPETGLSTFQVTENTYWVDDADSELYNQRVELDGEKTWSSAEHMIEYPQAYKYGFVVNFNMNPVEPGRGSAIFFHVGNQATLGCIATSEDMVLAYLEKLSKDQNPYIVIQ